LPRYHSTISSQRIISQLLLSELPLTLPTITMEDREVQLAQYESAETLVSNDNAEPEPPVRHAETDIALDRLTAALERMLREPRPAPTTIKPPKFDGKGDVEFFIEQFEAVSDANEWSRLVQLLQLRESLQGSAQDCGKGHTINEIYQHLRTRYSLTPKEARSQLNSLKKNPQQTLHEHAAEIQRLVSLAYQDLPDRNQNTLALECFFNTLSHPALQRHLLAIQPDSLTQAVQAGNEFLQIKPASQQPRSSIHALEDDGEDPPVTASLDHGLTLKVMTTLAKQLEQLQQYLIAFRQPPAPAHTQTPTPRPAGCWGCGAPHHIRRNCPTSPWKTTPASQPATQSGNANSPRQ
jgi:hypothetical protein